MNYNQIKQFIHLRLIIGYLGEISSPVWWNSQLFSPTGTSFLKHVFPKSIPLARYHGIREIGCQHHDNLVGLGNIYHVFRLPETYEQELSRISKNEDSFLELSEHLSDRDNAMSYLKDLTGPNSSSFASGPQKLPSIKAIGKTEIDLIAGYYHFSFLNQAVSIPYFSFAN